MRSIGQRQINRQMAEFRRAWRAVAGQRGRSFGRPFWEQTMSTIAVGRSSVQSKLLWAAVIVLGTVSFGIVALTRGESVNAAWLVVAAVCVYFVAYRFYALFVANKAL